MALCVLLRRSAERWRLLLNDNDFLSCLKADFYDIDTRTDGYGPFVGLVGRVCCNAATHDVKYGSGLVGNVFGDDGAIEGVYPRDGIVDGGNSKGVVAMVRGVGLESDDGTVPLREVVGGRTHGVDFKETIGVSIPPPVDVEKVGVDFVGEVTVYDISVARGCAVPRCT